MNSTQFLSQHIFFTTRHFAMTMNLSVESASRKLHRLGKEKNIEPLTRGIWAQPHHPYYSPYGAVPYLLDNEQGYLSFLTALHRHGVISQIPRVIQVATTGRGRVLSSSLGTYEFFHLQPKMFIQGIEVHGGKLPYSLASSEKALLDTLYLSTRKNRRFLRLPELERDALQMSKIKKLMKTLPSTAQSLITPRLRDLKLLP